MTLDLDQKKTDLDSQENLETFKILVSTIENSRSRTLGRELSVEIKISRFSLDGHMQVQYFSFEIKTYRDFSRLFETFVIICDFCGFLNIFLNLDQEIMDFYKYLDRDFSSNPICLHVVLQNWLQNEQKVWEIQIFSKSLNKNLDYLQKNGNLDLS